VTEFSLARRGVRVAESTSMSIRASFLVASLAFTGCVNPDTITTDMMNQPPHTLSQRPVESVEVFTAGVPARPRVDVAVIRVAFPSGTPDPIVLMRRRAAEMGCDGLVLAHLDTGASGTCIVYSDGPAPAPTAPAPAPTAPAPAPPAPAPAP
jgi:hypothetical protein